MPISFHANEVSVDRKDWGVIVTLAGESTDGEDFYLWLRRKNHFTARDHELGMADVYIEYCGQGMSWYGHIDSFRLLKESVEVQLSAAAVGSCIVQLD